ncbi:hypothetical protein ACWEKM_08125 [Streptomyces sp. NPDC004752]
MIGGQRDPRILADLAKRRLRNKVPGPSPTLTGHFRERHGFLACRFLDQGDQLPNAVDRLTARIEEASVSFRLVLDLLDTSPGVNRMVAEVTMAAADMAQFAPGKHLAFAPEHR